MRTRRLESHARLEFSSSPHPHFSVSGLYAITPDESDTAALARKVELALRGGAQLLQYRNKGASSDVRKEQIATLLPLCRATGVPLIVNDDLGLALELGADGVHLGREDGDLVVARRALGSGKLLGSSCYADLECALAARAQGVDYVAFGAAFPTATKPHAVRAPLSLYSEARSRLRAPIVAIGGITLKNAASVITAGANAIAVISALFDAEDIESTAREFSNLAAQAGARRRNNTSR
jgi:thiamine-phosphate pyrophosphorylase